MTDDGPRNTEDAHMTNTTDVVSAIRELTNTIRIVVLRTVGETVEDPGTQVSLEEARFEDPDFQVGDVLEEEVPFEAFGRTAVQAAKQRIIQRVREGERA